MKKTILTVLLLTGFALAKDKNPADYPLTAHVLSVNTYTTAAASSEDMAPWTAQFRVGNLVYTTGTGCHKRVQVGADVRARADKRTFYVLTDDGHNCDAHIRGVREIPAK
jgi:hypothetical protein